VGNLCEISELCDDVELVNANRAATNKPCNQDRDTGNELLIVQHFDEASDNMGSLLLLRTVIESEINFDERTTALLEQL
jgi:hypothetical protein